MINQHLPPELEKEVIYLQQSYVSSKGVIVHALLAVGPVPEGEPVVKFMAMAESMVALAGMPGPVPIKFQFQIPGNHIEEAFANLPEAFKKAEGEAQIQARAEHRKRQLANLMQ
jgi:hypothetical protein